MSSVARVIEPLGAFALLHVAGEELELLQRRASLSAPCFLPSAMTTSCEAPTKLSFALRNATLYGCSSIEERLARRGVPDLQELRVVAPNASIASNAAAIATGRRPPVEPERQIREAIVEPREHAWSAFRRSLRGLDEGEEDRVERHDADEDRHDPEAREHGELLDRTGCARRRA